jgi:phosphoribosylanthranilate isomerase
VCAARDLRDVQAIVEGGADAAGVLVVTRHRAEDAVSLEAARRLLGAVPPPVSRYAVTHAIDYEDLSRIVEDLPIDTLQIHDHVERAVVEKLRSDYPEMRFVKALHVTDSGVGSYQEWEVSRPAHVAEAVAVTGAYVANVNSGVEVHGSKAPRLIRQFVRAVGSKGP